MNRKEDKEKDVIPYQCPKCGHKMSYEEYLMKGCRICELEEKNAS